MTFTMSDRRQIERVVSIVFALAIWQIGAMLIGKELLLVTPIAVAQRLGSLCAEPDFLSVIAFSFARILSGYLLGLVVSSVMAVIAGRFYAAEVMLRPIIGAIKSVPVASFIILCLIWLSSRSLSIFISFLMVFPIFYTNLLQGIKSTDKNLLEVAWVFRVGWLKKLKYIYLPQLKPYILSASSVSLGLAWKAGVAAEVIGIPDGSIGEKLYEAKVYLNSVDLFAWTVVIIALSVLLEKLFLLFFGGLFSSLEKS
jgi:NitT/TauT family transport system permease protein